MNVDQVPIWVLLIGTVLLVMLFIEVGFRLGNHDASCHHPPSQ